MFLASFLEYTLSGSILIANILIPSNIDQVRVNGGSIYEYWVPGATLGSQASCIIKQTTLLTEWTNGYHQIIEQKHKQTFFLVSNLLKSIPSFSSFS